MLLRTKRTFLNLYGLYGTRRRKRITTYKNNSEEESDVEDTGSIQGKIDLCVTKTKNIASKNDASDRI
jgi:hypothetical protein